MSERDKKEDEGGVEKRMKKMKAFLESEYEKKCPYKYGGETYLHYAASLDHVEATKALLEKGDEVNAMDLGSWTALHFAALYGHVDVTKVLIKNGADVNAVDAGKRTALHIAAQKGHVDFAEVLLQNGADVNAVEGGNWTVLYVAVGSKQIRCTLQLLCYGAEIDEKTIENDRTELLQPIEDRLKLLRSGNRMGTSLLCEEESKRLWCVAFCFTWKCRGAAFKAYSKVRSFVTFHGIFMGPGYGVGKDSVWNRKAAL